jgi:uncharacterized protein YyaL (SSP411 family)
VNRLAGETSPYLRQHADNPVDWYPWGDEAFEAARSLDRPMLLSVGYSACHWCHVMAHESFEDATTARYMNEHFVSVKVDREERPDVDAVYLEAVQAMTGSGGWPMTVFMSADGRPFFAGTYFPSDRRRGRPTFRELLEAISAAWGSRRDELTGQADALSQAVQARLSPPGLRGRGEGDAGGDGLGAAEVRASVEVAVTRLASMHDRKWGGFGARPKFPQAPLLELLLRADSAGWGDGAGAIVERTLGAMAAGGIYDHLGGGFARYSVDEEWLVPHFEKMLYDQASLARLYLHGWQVTGEARWLQVLEETVGYVLRDLRTAAGGVHSAEDADSEGEEGRFYVFTPADLEQVLGAKEAAEAAAWYGVTGEGNFEGRSILHRPLDAPLARPPAIERARRRLLEARSERVRPGRDDKILTEWNAMWCSALAEAAGATGSVPWREAAVETAEFLLAQLRRADGRWLRSWQDGRAAHLAYAADYAWLVDCFVRLAELTGEQRWLAEADVAADAMLGLFAGDGGGLFTTGHDAERLIVRPRELFDGVTPAASSVAAVALCRLGSLTGDATRLDAATSLVAAAADILETSPTALPHLLWAAELLAFGCTEIVIAGERPDLVAAAARRYQPRAVLAWGERAPTALWQGRDDGRAYVCRGGTCLQPATTIDELESAFALAAASSR